MTCQPPWSCPLSLPLLAAKLHLLTWHGVGVLIFSLSPVTGKQCVPQCLGGGLLRAPALPCLFLPPFLEVERGKTFFLFPSHLSLKTLSHRTEAGRIQTELRVCPEASTYCSPPPDLPEQGGDRPPLHLLSVL